MARRRVAAAAQRQFVGRPTTHVALPVADVIAARPPANQPVHQPVTTGHFTSRRCSYRINYVQHTMPLSTYAHTAAAAASAVLACTACAWNVERKITRQPSTAFSRPRPVIFEVKAKVTK